MDQSPTPALEPSIIQDPYTPTWYQQQSNDYQSLASSSATTDPPAQACLTPSTSNSIALSLEQEQPSTGQPTKPKSALQRERRMARERERTPINALLPDEIVPEPPHDLDEQVHSPSTRPCSMARQDVPAQIRCYVTLRADYVYRMCESCRMKFKLSEMRRHGIRYDGKYKATEQPSEHEHHDGRIKGKGRPHLIQYNGELILDPAFMHKYELDPRMFGPNGSQRNTEATEEAEFSLALKKATESLKRPRSRESTVTAHSAGPSVEPSSSQTPASSVVHVSPGGSEDIQTLTTPPDKPDFRNYRGGYGGSSVSHVPGGAMSETVAQNKSSTLPNDGLLRVRICTVKNCHNPVPIDYFWKMCQHCRDNYKVWGVAKRQRQRERRLQKLAEQNKEKYEQALARSQARLKLFAKEVEEQPSDDTTLPFDPTIPPRPCTIPNCKNHVPGNSIYKRCEMHRQDTRVHNSSYHEKRERLRSIFRMAKEDGRDPEEALREYLQWRGNAHSDEEDEGESAAVPDHKDKERKKPNINSNDPGESIYSRHIPDLAICVGKGCMNLLNPLVQNKFCDACKYLAIAPSKKKGKGVEASQISDTPTIPPTGLPSTTTSHLSSLTPYQHLSVTGMDARNTRLIQHPSFDNSQMNENSSMQSQQHSQATVHSRQIGDEVPNNPPQRTPEHQMEKTPPNTIVSGTTVASSCPPSVSIRQNSTPDPMSNSPPSLSLLQWHTDPGAMEGGTFVEPPLASATPGVASSSTQTAPTVAPFQFYTPVVDVNLDPAGSQRKPRRQKKIPTGRAKFTTTPAQNATGALAPPQIAGQVSQILQPNPTQASPASSSIPSQTIPALLSHVPLTTPPHPIYQTYGWPLYPYPRYPVPPPATKEGSQTPQMPNAIHGFPPPPYVMPPPLGIPGHGSDGANHTVPPTYPYPYPPYPYVFPPYLPLPPEVYLGLPSTQSSTTSMHAHGPLQSEPRGEQSASVRPPTQTVSGAQTQALHNIPEYIMRFLPPEAQTVLQGRKPGAETSGGESAAQSTAVAALNISTSVRGEGTDEQRGPADRLDEGDSTFKSGRDVRKVCTKCGTSLAKSYGRKFCQDCRKKTKALKMMNDAKRRHRLSNKATVLARVKTVAVGESRSVKLASTDDLAGEFDEDAEGDADQEVE